MVEKPRPLEVQKAPEKHEAPLQESPAQEQADPKADVQGAREEIKDLTTKRGDELTQLNATRAELGLPPTDSNIATKAYGERFERLKAKADALRQQGQLKDILEDPEYQAFEKELEEAKAHFAPIEAQFKGLPETSERLLFSQGEVVLFPASENDRAPVEWTIVRAEKANYLLEREEELSPTNLVYVLCSQQELLEFNSR